MLNLKKNENDADFDKICKKKKIKIRVKFQKIKGTFLDSIPWLKSHQPPLIYRYIRYMLFTSSRGQPL